MKIIVETGDHRIFLPIPTALIFNRPMMRLWLRMMRQSQEYVSLPEEAGAFLWNLPEESVLRLCDELRRIKRKRGSWDLVEVQSASGEQVLIQL